MMLYPPMSVLAEKAGSRYLLVNLVARRARNIAAAAQAALSQVLALGEPTTKALTPKPNLSPAVKPTTAVTKIPTRAVTKTSRKGRK